MTVASPRTRHREWSALPRRRPTRRVPTLLAIRTPIPTRTRRILATLSVLGPLAIWWLLSISGVVDPPTYLPTPPAVWAALTEMARTGDLLTDTLATLQRLLVGFGAAVAVSVPLGILMGSFRSAQALFEPIVGLLRYLPAGAFIPLLIIWMGLESRPR